jgi:hypothetical protein
MLTIFLAGSERPFLCASDELRYYRIYWSSLCFKHRFQHKHCGWVHHVIWLVTPGISLTWIMSYRCHIPCTKSPLLSSACAVPSQMCLTFVFLPTDNHACWPTRNTTALRGLCFAWKWSILCGAQVVVVMPPISAFVFLVYYCCTMILSLFGHVGPHCLYGFWEVPAGIPKFCPITSLCTLFVNLSAHQTHHCFLIIMIMYWVSQRYQECRQPRACHFWCQSTGLDATTRTTNFRVYCV